MGRNRAFRFLTLASALVLLLGALPVFAKSSDEIRDEISALEQQSQENLQQMEELENKISENFSQMVDLVESKDAIDRQISLLYAQRDNLNERIRLCSLLAADKQEELETAQENLEQLRLRFKERIRAMEEQGDLSYWSVLFKASSFADLLDRIQMIREIAQADQKRMELLAEATARVEAAKEALEKEKASLEENRQELQALELVLQEKRVQAEDMLRQLVERGAEFEALLHQSEEKQESLMTQLAQKETELDEAEYREWLESYVPPVTQEPAPEIPENDSDWITPVPWYILTSPFGMRLHPILGYERMHNGVDLACDEGTAIYASRGGVVTVADYQAGGAGNYVQIDHGDGFKSIYMHMTRYIVSPGQYVAPGQVIGYVGNTGLSKGNHLHFGISYNGTYVNPMEYIG